MTLSQIEKRLLALEKSVDHLTKNRQQPSPRWWVDEAGRFENDPVFDQIVKLGRKYRRSLRPRSGGNKRDHS